MKVAIANMRTECAARVMRELHEADVGIVTHRPGVMSRFRWFSFIKRPEAAGSHEMHAMHHARLFFTVLYLVGSLMSATRAIAAEDPSPPSITSHEVNVLRQVAAALAAGNDAIQDLRGPPIENSNLDRLKLPTPGMDCGIARTLMFVVCRSTSFNKQEAEAMFARMMEYGRAGLSSGGWRPVEAAPHTGLIRSIRYHHPKSGAQIDLDLVAYPSGEAEPLYAVRFFGWPRL